MKPYSKQVDSEPAEERDNDIETIQQGKASRRDQFSRPQMKRKHRP